jgi:hypothetical protein
MLRDSLVEIAGAHTIDSLMTDKATFLKEAKDVVDQAVRNPDGLYQLVIRNTTHRYFEDLSVTCESSGGFV